jgi:hypothetical protein
VKLVGSFISNRTTTLCLPGYITDAFSTHAGIPQGSPLSLILFLFYNAILVDACNLPTSPSSGISFVDDVNALAFSKTTEDNCRSLQSIHKGCIEWARKHGALFAPEKYILVHFNKARTKNNTACPLTLPSLTITPCPAARILGVILDKKLSLQQHLRHIKSKLAIQTNILRRLTAQLGVPPYGSRGCSTLLSSVLPSQLAALHGRPPLTHHLFEKGLEKSYRKPKTDATELLLEPTRLHQYEAFWLKWEYPRCLFTWTAGKPDFD